MLSNYGDVMNKYDAFIIDFDGTLYYKLPLKIGMFIRIVAYLILHPYKYKDILIIKEYRVMRKKRIYADSTNFYHEQYKYLANKYNYDINYIKDIINKWMFIIPKRYINKYQNKKLIKIINDMYELNKKIIIYSDYPIEDKISVLNVKYHYLFSSNDEIIKCMKPDSRGLKNIIKLIDIDKKKILYIGDDNYLDGECAKNSSISFINVRDI